MKANDLVNGIFPRWKNSPTWMAVVFAAMFVAATVSADRHWALCVAAGVAPFVVSWAGVKWL